MNYEIKSVDFSKKQDYPSQECDFVNTQKEKRVEIFVNRIKAIIW